MVASKKDKDKSSTSKTVTRPPVRGSQQQSMVSRIFDIACH